MEHISDADDSHGEPRRGNVKESGQKRRKTVMDKEQMEEEIIKRKRHNDNDNRLA